MDAILAQLKVMLVDYAPKLVGALATLIIGFWIAGRIVAMVKKTMNKRNSY